MKHIFPKLCRVAALALVAVLSAGCDDDCYNCGVEVGVSYQNAGVVHYGYAATVWVSDRYGVAFGHVPVEFTVAMVPERRMHAMTSRDGYAIFYFDAPPDVVAIAYACAPGYTCNAADLGTRADRHHLDMHVVLRP